MRTRRAQLADKIKAPFDVSPPDLRETKGPPGARVTQAETVSVRVLRLVIDYRA
ncbi:MAG TPA: hypothetical protein VE485_08170 [Mycobacterium sp.]|nr:hypothetical protein [Mycobacterium sp.]